MRTVLWFLGVLAAMWCLQLVPVVGGLFRIPLLGFFLAAAVVAWVGDRASRRIVARRRFRALERSLGSVETPRNDGKLGTFLESRGRHREAVERLERAVSGEPDVVEWRYRLGRALLGAGRAAEAATVLAAAAERDEEHAYGGVLLQLSAARLAAGDGQGALAALERFERNHGPKPESAYRRSRALRALGRKDEAERALSEVGRLASAAHGYQRGDARRYLLRSWFARLGL